MGAGPGVPPMAKITSDLGHALSRPDQHRNRLQLYLKSTGFLLFFLRKWRGEVLKKFGIADYAAFAAARQPPSARSRERASRLRVRDSASYASRTRTHRRTRCRWRTWSRMITARCAQVAFVVAAKDPCGGEIARGGRYPLPTGRDNQVPDQGISVS